MLLNTASLEARVDLEPLGSLSVLNCSAGDLKFRFDKDDPTEVAQAQRVIEDMLRRGYTILVEVDGELRRATSFDPSKGCYVVTEPPAPVEVVTAPEPETFGAPAPAPKKKGKPTRREVPASKTRATAIAPTAGG